MCTKEMTAQPKEMTAQPKEKSLATLAAMQFVAGGCAGNFFDQMLHSVIRIVQHPGICAEFFR